MTNKTYIVTMNLEFGAETREQAEALARLMLKLGFDHTDDPRRQTQFHVANIIETRDAANIPPVGETTDLVYEGFKALAPTFAEASPFLFEQFVTDQMAKRSAELEHGYAPIAYGVEDLIEMEMLLVQARKK